MLWSKPALASPSSFYLDATYGDDTADGTSTTRPWASLARVRDAIATGEIVAGSTIRLRRGRRFHGIVRAKSVGALHFESWGNEPEPPIVTAYKYVQGEGCWKRTGEDLWSVDISAANVGRTHHGYVSSWSTEIGFLKVGSTIHGDRKSSAAALLADWQFTSIGAVVTVRCAENPSVGGRRVWLAVAEPIVEGRSQMTIRDLAILGTGRNAVQTASASSRTEGLTVSNCVIGEAGGGIASDGVSRMGNGVQVWSGSSDVLVSGNSIVDCYDTAMTIQGPAPASGPTWSNIEFNGNTTARNMQTFEYWSSGTSATDAESTCSVRGNVASGAGSSWSADVRPDRSGKGTHLLFYADGIHPRITVRGNRFDGAKDSYLYASGGIPVGLVSDENRIALAPRTRLHWQRSERIAQRESWIAATGLERRSVFSTLD